MHCTARFRANDVVRYLLEKHPEVVKARCNNRWYTLNYAAACHGLELIWYLLKQHCEALRAHNADGSTALHLEDQSRSPELVELLAKVSPESL
jgi:ankyrin repeat protein